MSGVFTMDALEAEVEKINNNRIKLVDVEDQGVEVIDLVTSYHPKVHFSTGQFPRTQLVVHQPIHFKLKPFIRQEKI